MIAEACPAESAAEQESYLLENFMICENYPPEVDQEANFIYRSTSLFSENRISP
jgi:hypothetical protein